MLDQLIILLTGPLSVYWANDKRETYRKFAATLALLGQPAWFYAAWIARQWGIFILDIFYVYAWYRGYKAYRVQRRDVASLVCGALLWFDNKLALTNITRRTT